MIRWSRTDGKLYRLRSYWVSWPFGRSAFAEGGALGSPLRADSRPTSRSCSTGFAGGHPRQHLVNPIPRPAGGRAQFGVHKVASQARRLAPRRSAFPVGSSQNLGIYEGSCPRSVLPPGPSDFSGRPPSLLAEASASVFDRPWPDHPQNVKGCADRPPGRCAPQMCQIWGPAPPPGRGMPGRGPFQAVARAVGRNSHTEPPKLRPSRELKGCDDVHGQLPLQGCSYKALGEPRSQMRHPIQELRCIAFEGKLPRATAPSARKPSIALAVNGWVIWCARWGARLASARERSGALRLPRPFWRARAAWHLSRMAGPSMRHLRPIGQPLAHRQDSIPAPVAAWLLRRLALMDTKPPL
jgi:hypothetical protein